MLTLEEINKRKTQHQTDGFGEWRLKGRGVFVWATATGKTHLATHHAIPAMNRKRPDYKTIVVVPKTFLKEDWEGTGRKAGHIKKNGLKNVEVWVINSFVKMRHQCHLLIIDEIHRIANEDARLFNQVLDLCPAPYILGLSATLTQEQKNFLFKKNIPIISTITTRQAETEGLISPYRIYNLGIDLIDKDKAIQDELDENFVKYASKFDRDFKLAMACNGSINPRWNPGDKESDEEIEEFPHWYEPRNVEYAREKGWNGINLDQAIKNYQRKKKAPHGQKGSISIWEDEPDDFEFTPTKIQIYASQYIRYMNKRQDYLHNAYQKLDITKQIVEKFKVPTIIFSQRTAFADRITNLLGEDACISYHSKLESQPLKNEYGEFIKYKTGKRKGEVKLFGTETLKKHNLESFEKRRVQSISTALSLDEGFNVDGIELAVITGGTSTERQNTQRIGRAVRAKEGKVAVIVNLYVKGGQDEIWLRKRQLSDKAPIWITNINEIKFGRGETIELENDDSNSLSEEEDFLSF